jgi:hypothetical protein
MNMKITAPWTLPMIIISLVLINNSASGFLSPQKHVYAHQHSPAMRLTMVNDDDQQEAARLRKQAEELREQIRKMEDSLGNSRARNYDLPSEPEEEVDPDGLSLKKKRVLVVGANGRLGSMVCKYLLRNNPQTEVVACVHYVGESGMTSRGYGRLSYEVGAEDGVGRIGAAWSAEDRTATFEYADYMKDYNLKNLRLVECELLDPVQCNTICEGVDSVIWCATDFNGNQPRAISGLNVAFLFRAIASPMKGRVEIEGVRNILGGLKNAKQNENWNARTSTPAGSGSGGKQPLDFVVVSTSPDAFEDFETPFGTFNGLKREGEDIVKNEFPSLSYAILQMSRYEDNFVPEDLDIELEEANDAENPDKIRRRINRRDAARAAADALTNEDLAGKKVQVWSQLR